MREILEEELPGRERLDVGGGPARDLRARALLDDRRERRPLAARSPATSTGCRTGSARRGYNGDVLLLHSGGGVMTPKLAERYAVRLAASGIAAGAIASRHIADAVRLSERDRLRHGRHVAPTSRSSTRARSAVTKEWFVEYGYPICFPSIEVLTIGAGGGSLAWIDEAGSLRNGPQSAGANPGPACYGRGNDEPTNTDANLVLGRLGEELIGGAMAARPGCRRAGDPRARRGAARARARSRRRDAVIRVANANMADAVRLISIRRGYDPREFASSPSAAQAPCTARRSPRSCRSRRCSCRPARASPPRSAACSSTSATTCPAMFLAHVDAVDTDALEAEFGDSRRRRGSACRPRASRRSRCRCSARRHALPRPVALADGGRVGARRPRASSRRVPRRARARATTTAATARRSRSTASASGRSA